MCIRDSSRIVCGDRAAVPADFIVSYVAVIFNQLRHEAGQEGTDLHTAGALQGSEGVFAHALYKAGPGAVVHIFRCPGARCV